jgi:hypothetical protein
MSKADLSPSTPVDGVGEDLMDRAVDAYHAKAGKSCVWDGLEAALEVALASFSTPVDGVGAEPRVKPLEWKATGFSDGEFAQSVLGSYFAYPTGSWTCPKMHHTRFGGSIDEAKAVAQADYEAHVLSALANPEAEARLRERVDVKQMIADVEAGKHNVFVNKGEDPHGNGSELDCPYCGGSGHNDDVAYGFEYNGEGYSATGAEARLAQSEGSPAVTEAIREAANIAYRVCAETRHISLGDKCRDAILEAALHPQSAAGEEGK